ncbi:MAG: helix-turn-helix domain-containing protein [Nocardioidaceae bacterium]
MATTGVGGRVAEERKLAGLTQQQLAIRANVSTSLIRAVEQGRLPASPSFVSAVSRALSVGVPDLLDQPFPRESRADHRIHSTVPGLRRELASYALPPDETLRPRPLSELAQAVAEASRLRHQASLHALGIELPGLLEELRAAVHVHQGADREQIFGLLAEAYAAAGQVAYKLGYSDLSSLATERVEWAAAQAGDELAVAAGAFYRAGELIVAANWNGAQSFLDGARHDFEDRLSTGDEAALSMWGQLHLKSGLAAARAGDRDTADDHLAEAQDVAVRVAPDRDDYRLAFNADSVKIWSVSLAVEMADGTEAVKRSEAFAPMVSMPRERVGHYWIDLARGWLLHGDRERALSSLISARHTAPQQTRYHPMVHETVRMLARQDRRRSDGVQGFAAWCGIG